ncbi:hypothetical protein [Candidatus Cytomitobacter primus]|nr:hypothetical protein [Candidatus Cytomitobacter primus]
MTSNGFSVNDIKYRNVHIKSLNIGIIKPFINIKKFNIFKIDFDMNMYYKNGLHIDSAILNNKLRFKSLIHKNVINITTSGLDQSEFKGVYYGSNIIMRLPKGLFVLSDGRLNINSENKKYFLMFKADLYKKEVQKMNFYSKTKKLNISFDEMWNFESKNENMHLKMQLDKYLIGDGKIIINKKFGILDSHLNFKINASNMKVHAYNYGKQFIKINDFGLHEQKIKWDLHFNVNEQFFTLKSDNLKVDAKFLTNNIKFNLFLNSDKIDLAAFGKMDYYNNIQIEGYGDYISLLDMQSLFKKGSDNSIECDFKWKKAKWIADLFLEDMTVNCYKNKDGFKSCLINSHFEGNPVKLWKSTVPSPLHFKIWNFARAFELMYGEKLFKSTGILDGSIHVSKKGMPWNFTLYDFESMQNLNAIYLQILSLKFWASIFKNNQKKWDHLTGNGHISHNKYEIDHFEMDNDYFNVNGSGFIHRHDDLMDINGLLLSKSLTNDLQDLMNRKDRNKIPFHMYGGLKDIKVDNQVGFKKLAVPILPLAFFLI